MFLGTLQADHVDPGELGGLNSRAGGWNMVPRWSVLPCGLLPGPRRSQLQLLQSPSGQMAHNTEQASGRPLPGWCALLCWPLLHPHRLRDFPLLPLPRGRGVRGWPSLLPTGLPLQCRWAILLPKIR